MAEPTENLRLAERLAAIASALATPPATNGHAGVMADDLSEDLLNALAAALVPFVKQLIADAVAEPLARIAELEKKKGIASLARRLAELEDAALLDGDIWNEHSKYRKGCVVTHGGNLWLCKQENSNSRPPSDYWRLMNKTKAQR